MKVYFFSTDPSDESALKQLISKNPELADAKVEAVFISEPLSVATADKARDADAVSVFVHCTVDAAVLEKMPKVKLIATRSTGFDSIDLVAAAAKGIVVSNVPAYGSRTVAEYAFSLILGLSRKTFAAALQIKNNHDFSIAGFEGFDLQGKTLGIIGTGRIGLNAAKIAKGFDMNVLGFDAFPNAAAANEIGFAYADLDALLAAADVITVHVPYLKTTHHLLSDVAFGKMKKGVVLVNTSRGEIIDTEALIRALDVGIVGSAGLDVIEGERALSDDQQVTTKENHVLMDYPQVFITPHIAFFSKEAKHEILKTTVDNLVAFVKNTPINIVK